METKFTKGEWEVRNDNINLCVFDELPERLENASCFNAFMVDVKDSKKNIVLIPNDCVSIEESKANAKLIAASPELYYSMCAILDTLDGNINPDDIPLYNEIESAKKVLKKATE